MRKLPAVSAIGVLHVLSACQETAAPVLVPFSSSNASGVVTVAPAAAFQCAFAITPAVSVAAMAVPVPTNSMLIAVVTDEPLDTTSCTVVLCTSVPLAPVTVTVYVPTGVAAVVAI